MNRLVKNELIKVFHKKSIYIVLIITLVAMILGVILNKVLYSLESLIIDNQVEYLEESLNTLEEMKKNGDLQYFTSMKELEANIESTKIELEFAKVLIKYDKDSWQYYIMQINGYQYVANVQNTIGTEEHEDMVKEYNNFMNSIDNGDWKDFANKELEEINALLSDGYDKTKENQNIDFMNIDEIKNKKQALEWRLEKDISYGNNTLSNFIESWYTGKNELYSIEQSEKKKELTHSQKYEKQLLEEQIYLSEYAIANKVENKQISKINGGYELISTANEDLLGTFSNYYLFIVIAIVLIAGTIMSEEFNKGTIKLLLVRPYKRIKIYFAKLITCFIVLAIIFAVVTLMQFVVGGIANGFNNYTATNAVYNFSSNSVENINICIDLLLNIITKMPMFILLMTLAFSLSTIINNSPLAIALPLIGSMGGSIINSIAYSFEKAKFLMFFVTPNWDLSIFLFGKLPQFEPISLPFSIFICSIYFMIMVISGLIVFKKRNVKNI